MDRNSTRDGARLREDTPNQRRPGCLSQQKEVNNSFHLARDEAGITLESEELRRLVAAQDLAMRELEHRLKNQLALLRALIFITTKSSNTPAEMAGKLSGRLEAMAIAVDFIRGNGIERQSRDLNALLAAVLTPFIQPHSDRIAIQCDLHMALGHSAASTLALMIHELATNAEKHGALSTTAGHVCVSCRSEPQNMLAIRWEETGGSGATGNPPRHGFGSRLLLEGARQIGGRVSVNWGQPEGIAVEIMIPLAGLHH